MDTKPEKFTPPKGRTDLPREEYESQIMEIIKFLDVKGLLRVLAYIKKIW